MISDVNVADLVIMANVPTKKCLFNTSIVFWLLLGLLP